MRTNLSAKDIEAKPYLVWNEFINLIADQELATSTVLRPAHLVFRYESEVQNGGHLQYFENGGAEVALETVMALDLLGASCQRKILSESVQVFVGLSRPRPRTIEEYVAVAREAEFDGFDKSFHACSPDLIAHLEHFLEANLQLLFTIS